MAQFAGHGDDERIFFHKPACLGERSYTVHHINRIFEEGINSAGLHLLLAWMMEYLQDGFHKSAYPGPAGEYLHAHEEYPAKYIALVEGLSDHTIAIISAMDTSSTSGEIDKDMGKRFCDLLLRDRAKLQALEAKERAEVTALVPIYAL